MSARPVRVIFRPCSAHREGRDFSAGCGSGDMVRCMHHCAECDAAVGGTEYLPGSPHRCGPPMPRGLWSDAELARYSEEQRVLA